MSTPEEMEYWYAVFMRGFWLGCAFNLTGLIIRIVRLLRRRGVDVMD